MHLQRMAQKSQLVSIGSVIAKTGILPLPVTPRAACDLYLHTHSGFRTDDALGSSRRDSRSSETKSRETVSSSLALVTSWMVSLVDGLVSAGVAILSESA